MPEERTLQQARAARRKGRSPSTQAGEFVREEIEHIREGKHGARSVKQAIAIGLSKARRAGVPLKPPRRGVSDETQEHASRDYKRGQTTSHRKPAPRRSRAVLKALKKEDRSAASHIALSRQAHASSKRRGSADRKRAAHKAVLTKGVQQLRRAAAKAARTRSKAA